MNTFIEYKVSNNERRESVSFNNEEFANSELRKSHCKEHVAEKLAWANLDFDIMYTNNKFNSNNNIRRSYE